MTTCPNCENQFSRFNSEKTCPICGEIFCEKCLVQNRLCANCNSIIPREFQQKFRVWNIFPQMILFIIAIILLSYAFLIVPDWYLLKGEEIFGEAIPSFILIGIALILIFVSICMEYLQLGNIKFDKWIKIPSNLEQITQALEALEQGRYTARSSIFEKKEKFLNFVNEHQKETLFIPALLLNLGFGAFYMMRNNMGFENLSVFAGIIAALAIFYDFLLLILAISNRIYNPKLWIKLILLVTVLVYAGFAYVFAVTGGILEGDASFKALLLGIHDISTLVLFGLWILYSIKLIINGNYKNIRNSDIETINLASDQNGLQKMILFFNHIFRNVVIFILFIFLIIGMAYGLLIIIGDYFLFGTYFSLQLTLGLFIPICIVLCKLLNDRQRAAKKHSKYKNNPSFWIVLKISLFIVSANLVTTVSTPAYTNIDTEKQFSKVFGENWESKIPSELASRMRPYKYSFFDNNFGWNISVNALYNVRYMSDSPSCPDKNKSSVHDFYFDAYLPEWLDYGVDAPTGTKNLLPVIIMMHGEVEDNGPWNANMTSQYLANQGYLVCDMNYGYITGSLHGDNNNGYLLRQVVEQIGTFTKVLEQNKSYFHANLSNTYFSGRHLGGALSLICGYGYNSTALNGIFSSNMVVRGVIPYYPITNFGESNDFFYGDVKEDQSHESGCPYFNSSSDESDPNYDPNWQYLNPIDIVNSSTSKFAPTWMVCGSHDLLIPYKNLETYTTLMETKNQDVVLSYYHLGSDGFDGNHITPWGQSIVYYYERFLALTRADY
jgi:acetyl esterase/lipase